jgi:molybdenum cofactor cytidylyltransferase
LGGDDVISAVVLAAGKSERFGGTKLLLPFAGSSLIATIATQVLQSQADEVILVTGHDADRVSQEIRRATAELGKITPLSRRAAPAKILFNPNFAAGQSTSIQTGLAAVDEQSAGVLILMGDQPFVDTVIIDRLLAQFLADAYDLVVPVYPDGPASPVLFNRSLFSELMSVTGDRGGREIVRRYLNGAQRDLVARVAIDSPQAALDIDTPEEYEYLLKGCDENG